MEETITRWAGRDRYAHLEFKKPRGGFISWIGWAEYHGVRHPLPRHRHPDHQEYFQIIRGTHRFDCQGESFHLRGGDGLMLPAGPDHDSGGVPQEKAAFCWMGFLSPAPPTIFGLPAKALSEKLLSPRPVRHRVDPTWSHLIRKALEVHESDDPPAEGGRGVDRSATRARSADDLAEGGRRVDRSATRAQSADDLAEGGRTVDRSATRARSADDLAEGGRRVDRSATRAQSTVDLAEYRLDSVLFQALLLLADGTREEPNGDPSPRIRAALQFMKQERPMELTVGQLADRAGLSPTTFKARFIREVGMAPKEYLTRLQITDAQARLAAQPGLSITALAHELGFSSSQYFATVFKRHTGTSPTDIQRMAKSIPKKRT